MLCIQVHKVWSRRDLNAVTFLAVEIIAPLQRQHSPSFTLTQESLPSLFVQGSRGWLLETELLGRFCHSEYHIPRSLASALKLT